MDTSMNAVVLELDDLKELADDDLKQRIAEQNGELCVRFPMPSIGSTNEPADIASDYVDASFFAEHLAPLCIRIRVEPINHQYGMSLRFSLAPSNSELMLRELRRLAPGVSFDDEPDDAVRQEVAEFEEEFFDRTLRVPELGDNSVANFIHGSHYWENTRYWHDRFPTWKWGFWRSFAFHTFDCELYTSAGLDNSMWIVLADRKKVEYLLEQYGGFSASGARLRDALPVPIAKSPHVLLTREAAVRVPTVMMEKALRCWRHCLLPRDLPTQVTSLSPSEQEVQSHPELNAEAFHQRHERDQQNRRSNWEHRLGLDWLMTDNGDAIVCGNQAVNFVAFVPPIDRVRPEMAQELLGEIELAAELVRDMLGLNVSSVPDLGTLTPEEFEELCYDVLIRCGTFDGETARRHGKTRSRDGGRDIEIWTRPRFDKPSVKWIFQCKRVAGSRSLGGSKVVVSDVIDQYVAGGFGIMTNAVIDSTLYDKLDAITARRCVERDTWDGQRLHRFVRARPDLLERYFPA
ncbi:MAG: restriction endonuclease [Planctomycetes bacterium]|nr:restriction endonuclease [Planctomycetota bacterium]